MKTLELAKILSDCELTSAEKELLELNIEFTKHKLFMIKKIGIQGIRGLAVMVNYRMGIVRLFSGNIKVKGKCVTIIRKF